MSEFYDLADAIAARLTALPSLAGSRVAVDRQHDILAELRKVIGKQTGNLVLVSWTGGANRDESGDGPEIESGYNVTIFAKPVIRAGEAAADDLAQDIARSLHNWEQDPNNIYSRLICTSIAPVDLPELLAIQIRFKITSQL